MISSSREKNMESNELAGNEFLIGCKRASPDSDNLIGNRQNVEKKDNEEIQLDGESENQQLSTNNQGKENQNQDERVSYLIY